MRIVTSKNEEYSVDWIDTPVQDGNRLLLQMRTDKTLAEIASAFDGLEWIERYDENQGDKRYEGYSRLTTARTQNGRVLLVMERGE